MREGWRHSTLGDVAEFQNGYPFKPRELGRDGLPVIRIKQLLDASEVPDRSTIDVPIRHHIDDGHLIFSWSGTLAVRLWDRGPALLNQHLFRVTEREGIDRGWLRVLLDHAIAELEDKTHGTTMRHITKADLLPHAVVVPPLEDQRRTADLVDSIDHHVGECRRLAAAADALYHALLDEHYRGASEGYASVMLGELADTRLGKMLDAKKQSGEAFPYLANINVRWDEVVTDDLRAVSLTSRERSELSLLSGDVLVCEGGEAGRTAVLADDLPGVYFQKAIHRVRCGTRLRPRYLMHFMRFATKNGVLDEFLSSLTIQHLTGQKLRRVPLPLPPVPIQDVALGELDSVRTLAHKAAAAAAATTTLRNNVLAELLSGGHEIPETYDRFLDGVA